MVAKVSPRNHKCDVPDLDYTDVQNGLIVCTVCQRKWRLNLDLNQWWPTPCPECNISASMCRHYGRKEKKKRK